MRTIICLVAALGLCLGQQVGSTTTETHPSLTTYTCTSPTSCVTQSRSVTMDANWRWLHDSSGSNCYSGNKWDSKYCADQDTCATSCYLEGSDYSGTYGVTTSSDALTLKLVTVGTYSTNVGSRLYLMASESKYEMFKVMNREFAFDVDVSNLPCGLNGALYFVEMDETGNMGVGNNKAGAKFGTGYCDGQCPHDVKFINGQANVINWTGTSTNSGKGKYGSCCGEMDIWEANSISTAFTPHNCDNSGLYRCSTPQECGDNDGHRYQGVCDKDGCDWNHYRMGNTTYYGPGMTVDTKSKFTVVTQFITSDGTDTGDLVEIRRYYRQNGVVIPNAFSTWSGLTQYDSVTDESCTALKSKFGDTDDFKNKGGMTSHGNMLKRGVVLVLSLWDDYDAYMLWLDSNYPTSGTATTPGVARGSCATTTGVPSDVEKNSPGASVIFSSIKVGPFGGTTADIPIPSTASSTAKTTTSSAGATIVSSAGAAVVSSTAAVVASSVEAAVVSSAGALSSNTESADESSHSISSASSLVATLATLAALRVAA